MTEEYVTKEQFKKVTEELDELKDIKKKMDKKLDVHIAISKTLEEQDEKQFNRDTMGKRIAIGIVSASCAVIATVFTFVNLV